MLKTVPRPVVGAVLALGSKGMGMLVQIMVVILAMRYIGREEYGILAIVLSVGGFGQFADVGLSQPLVNFAAEVSAQGRGWHELRCYGSTAFFGMAVIACSGVVLTIAFCSVPLVGHLLGVPPSGQAALATVVSCYLISLPFVTAAKLQTGFQQYVSQYVFQFAGSLVALALLWWVTSHKLALLAIVLAIQAPVTLACFVNWVHFHWWRRSGPIKSLSGTLVSPSARLCSVQHFKRLLSRGAMPIISQLASAVIYIAPVWTIGKVLGVMAAGRFYTPYRLLSPVPIAVGLATAPLWPAYAEAWGSRDQKRAKKIFGRSVVFGTAFAVLGLGGILLLGVFGQHVSHTGAYYSNSEAILIACWFAVMVIRQLLTTASLGLGGARFGLLAYVIALVLIGAVGASGGLLHSVPTVMWFFIGLEILLLITLSVDVSNSLKRTGVSQGHARLTTPPPTSVETPSKSLSNPAGG
jgi:O-antigen/teichoic acid export membrane protein